MAEYLSGKIILVVGNSDLRLWHKEVTGDSKFECYCLRGLVWVGGVDAINLGNKL